MLLFQVPKDWKLDPEWDAEPKQPLQPSYLRKFPSKWRASSSPDPVNSVKIVDHFVIQQSATSSSSWFGSYLHALPSVQCYRSYF